MEKAQYVQAGDIIDFFATEEVLTGDIVIIGNLVGITKRSVPVGTYGGLAITGVYDIVKETNMGMVFSVGDKVYWDDQTQLCVAAPSGTLTEPLGVAVKEAEDGDKSVRVRLAG